MRVEFMTLWHGSLKLITTLNPYVGYDKASEIAKSAILRMELLSRKQQWPVVPHGRQV
jgi:fumarate hydratase class II